MSARGSELMARIAEWDALLCWDFSRLARNEDDLGWVRNRLKAARKNAYAVNTGRSIHPRRPSHSDSLVIATKARLALSAV
jgi:hypothetical protein